MRIVFLNKYQNKVYRGVETFVTELSKRLSKNHEVDVVADVNYLKLLRKKYDVIVPTNGRLQALIIRKIAWFTGAKVIISGQSGMGFDDRINLYSFPDAFVALSTYALEGAKKVNPSVKSVYIPNGVSLTTFKGSPLPGVKNTVLSVGAFTKEKRHDLTIKAVSKLQDVKLIIVGGGGDIKDEVAKLGNDMLGKGRFEIITARHNEMPDIYKKASVFAFPTVPWESFGIAILEAMSSNLPVVATNDPIRREIVGDAGFFVDPNNTEEYSGAIERALSQNWGDKPRKQAEKFSWDDITLEYENLIKELFKK